MPPRDKQPDPAQQPDPATLTDEQLAEQTEQAALNAGSAVKLAVQYPHDELRIDDDLVITTDGTLVPADREAEVRETARKYDVSLRKVT